jgi:hypothetical protein
MAVIDGSVTVRKALQLRPLSFDKEIYMFSLPTVFLRGRLFPAGFTTKEAVETWVKCLGFPKDALVAEANGKVVGALNGGVYNPFPV